MTSAFASYEEAAEILRKYEHEASLSRRLDLFSEHFLGLPYGKGGPLGEGPEGRYDQDPLYRFDTFDCTTYVETIMALASSGNAAEFEDVLNQVRYENGDVDYLKRNHFTDLQWIPNNIENGYMKDITFSVVPRSSVLIAEALVSYGGWLSSHKLEQIKVPHATLQERHSLLEELRSYARYYTPVTARVPYISIKSIVKNPAILTKVPSGSVVNLVRPNWDLTEAAGTRQNISHQGFLFRKGRTLYLRHASTTGKVEEQPFIDYLKKFENHPTLKGIHLMEVIR